MKFIFVTWWVVSGLWKWISAASIWRILKSAWYNINMVKMDPYLQVDAGTMSPYEHWEVFVTDDWAETDLDMGHYERFTNINLSWKNNITTWKLYWSIIQKERRWDFLWQTVQIIPHVTNEIKAQLIQLAKNTDTTIVEIWWTVGDIEVPPFLEAIRQLKEDIWKENVLYVHVAPLLYLPFSWEIKTKPIQHSIRDLRSVGIHADIIICRTQVPMDESIKRKISLLGWIEEEWIIEAIDAKTIYEVPLLFEKQNLWKIIQKKLWLSYKKSDLTNWKKLVDKIKNPQKQVTVAIAGKYARFKDAYMSLTEALVHAWAVNNVKVNINWLQTDDFEGNDYESKLKKLHKNWQIDWIIVPWWFGTRWIEWKINIANFARKNNIPFLGICLWLQVAVIEFARNVCWLTKANSTEFDIQTPYPVIDFIPDQINIENKWWTMRLGSYKAVLKKWTKIYNIYNKQKEVFERHRHRYEVNPKFHKILQKNWLILSGTSSDWKLVEFIELPNHKYFVATQAHPEFKSRLDSPHPLFDGLVRAVLEE